MRRASYIIGEYTVQEGTFRDVIKNLSAGGLFMKTDKKVKSNQPIIIKFPLLEFDQIIEVHGQIVRVEKSGFAVSFLNPIQVLISDDGKFPKIVHEANRSS